MKQLIKLYFPCFGEINRHEKVFPNSLNCFYQSNHLTHLSSSMEFPIPAKANRKTISVGFFLLLNHLKIQT